MNKQKIAFWIFTVIGSGAIAFAFILGMINQVNFAETNSGISSSWIVYGLIIVIGIAIILYGRTYKVKGFGEKTKYYILLLPIIALINSPIAYASSQSTFDSKFKKCFDAAPAPDYIKIALPLNTWEAIYKDYLGNLTMGKDIYANSSYDVNIAKQVDPCMRVAK